MSAVRVTEQSTLQVTFTILDETGAPVPAASVSDATLTLYDLGTYVPGADPAVGILNDRDAQDVLNAHDVTIHATSGLVTWAVQADDNVIVTTRRTIERHRAQFTFTWAAGQFNYEVDLEVVNLRGVSR